MKCTSSGGQSAIYSVADMPDLQQVLNIAIPSITFFLMVIVGLDLTPEDFKQIRRSPRSFVIGTLGQYLLPLIALLILKVLSLDPATAGGMILVASAPAGGISNYYTYVARANVALSIVLTAVSCTAAAFTMPLLLKIFEFILPESAEFHVPLLLLFGQLLLLLLVPVILGMGIRWYSPGFVRRTDRLLRALGFAFLGALIVFILHQTRDQLALTWRSIGLTATLFVLLSMLLGFATGLVFRFDRKDRFTIQIEYGVRNIAIATTAAVVILGRSEYAAFMAMYFLVEAVLIMLSIYLSRRFFSRPEGPSFAL